MNITEFVNICRFLRVVRTRGFGIGAGSGFRVVGVSVGVKGCRMGIIKLINICSFLRVVNAGRFGIGAGRRGGGWNLKVSIRRWQGGLGCFRWGRLTHGCNRGFSRYGS